MNIIKVTSIIALLSLAACGGGHSVQYSIAPEAQDYVNEFYKAAKAENVTVQNSDLIVKMGTLDDTLDGICNHNNDETPIITINSDTWTIKDRAEKLAIVSHELGHCLLNRSHLSTTMTVQWHDMVALPPTQPASVMNPHAAAVPMVDMENLKTYYFHELFHPQN